MVLEVIIKRHDNVPLEEEDELVKTLYEECQVDQNTQVPIAPTYNLFGQKQTQTSDFPTQIPITAISRFFPGTIEEPYDQVDRAYYFERKRFALFTLSTETLFLKENFKKLEPYDRTRYQIVYEYLTNQQDSPYETVPMEGYPMVWLELLCLDQAERGKGQGQAFLEDCLNKIADHYPEAETVIVGVDIPGTRNRFVNQRLKDFYTKAGFTLQQMAGSGNQIGFRLLREGDVSPSP